MASSREWVLGYAGICQLLWFMAVGIGIGVEPGNDAALIMGDTAGVGPASPKWKAASSILIVLPVSVFCLVVDLEVDSCLESPWAAFWEFAMGRDKPRSFPLLATPTPHVRVVL
jgi:hypothetical protein